MLARATLITALLAYLLVLGCVYAESRSAPAHSQTDSHSPTYASNAPLTGLPFCGAGMQIQRVDWMDNYKKSMDEIASIGADTVLLVVDMRMENGTSSKVYLDMRMTPDPEKLGSLIDHAKSRKLRVILMPILLLDNPKGTEWRGTIKPDSWEDWWQSYRDAMAGHFAWIAQSHHVDVLVAGSELVSTEQKKDEWTRTIRMIRDVYKGKLTYSANWDHYRDIPFWNQLDLFSTNCYYKLGDNRDVKLEEINKRWADIQNDLLNFSKKIKKPFLFSEVGWCSLANAASEPWDYTQETVPIDNDLQKRLYQSFFQTWWGKSNFAGFMIWEWAPGDGGKGTEDEKRGYTPENKPAEKVLREYFAKPRWEVK